MPFIIKAYYKNELASMYEISLQTLHTWLKPFVADGRLDLAPKQKILKPIQVEKIIEFLGEPPTTE